MEIEHILGHVLTRLFFDDEIWYYSNINEMEKGKIFFKHMSYSIINLSQ